MNIQRLHDNFGNVRPRWSPRSRGTVHRGIVVVVAARDSLVRRHAVRWSDRNGDSHRYVGDARRYFGNRCSVGPRNVGAAWAHRPGTSERNSEIDFLTYKTYRWAIGRARSHSDGGKGRGQRAASRQHAYPGSSPGLLSIPLSRGRSLPLESRSAESCLFLLKGNETVVGLSADDRAIFFSKMDYRMNSAVEK